MPVTPEDFVIYLCVVSEEMNLRASISQHVKGGLITGTSATVGGFCGGPLGVIMGGAFGGTLAAVSCKDKVEFVKDILLKMGRAERLKIFEHFYENLLEDEFDRAKSYSELSARLERNLDLKHEVIRCLKDYVMKNWKVNIIEK